MDTESLHYLDYWMDIRLSRPFFRRLPFGGAWEVRQFIRGVIIEAFDERLDEEWPRSQLSLSSREPIRASGFVSALEQLEPTIDGLLSDAWEERFSRPTRSQLPNEPQLGLIDVLVAINLHWCNIWPFCRPSRRQ